MGDSGEHVLYGYQGSGSAAIEAALTLAELPFRVVNAASWDAASELGALRQVNPLLQIPALRWPDGSTMTESAAILIELGLRHPHSGLLPQSPAARAHAIRGLVYIAANCYAAIGVIDYPERWTSGTTDTEREHVRQGTRARLHALWDRFAGTFPAQPFLSGEQPGALDLLAAVVSRWSGARKHLGTSRPQWFPVLERIDHLPAVAPVMARHWPAAA
ncbi:glutathione S-transferase [Ideonella sp. BN130291]|uniref:glutathione S-transferase n=1 Tax=Ideonella sp. BN130291 TaxID=3112940 RepID=UPI002E264992|nr:glutathione S-transferase [Ideonella sp. BN130291]